MFSASLELWGLNAEVKIQTQFSRSVTKKIKTFLMHSLSVGDELLSVSINVLCYNV